MVSPTRVNFNTLEQAISADLNRIGGLAGKAAQDPLISLTAGVLSSSTPRAVVRRGLDLSVSAGLGLTLEAGEFMVYDAGASADESKYSLGILLANAALTLAAADPVNPRIDAIHVAPVATATDSSVRNVLTLPSRAVSPVNVDKTILADLNVAITTGTPAATPSFPAVPGGRTAVWYVYVPAAAVALVNDHLMDARVYWQANGNALNLNARIVGLDPAVGSTNTRAKLRKGQGYVTGIQAVATAEQDNLMSALIQLGEPAFAADTQYDFFVVAKGNGVPVGKTVPDGLVMVATSSGAVPAANGQPSVSLIYGPLAFAAANAVATATLSTSTTRALYIGSLVSGAAASFASDSQGSPALDRQGLVFAHSIHTPEGRMPWISGMIRPGRFEWVSAQSARIRGDCAVLVNGTPATVPTTTFDLTTDRVVTAPDGAGLAASSWYYCYLRKRTSDVSSHKAPQRTFVPRMSIEEPGANGQKMTPEPGFNAQDYIYVGCVYNNGVGPAILEFTRDGSRYLFKDIQGGSLGAAVVAPTKAIADFNFMPKTARIGIGHMQILLDPTGAGQVSDTTRIFAETGRATEQHQVLIEGAATAAGIRTTQTYPFEVVTSHLTAPDRGRFEYNHTPTNVAVYQAFLKQVGFIEDPLALP